MQRYKILIGPNLGSLTQSLGGGCAGAWKPQARRRCHLTLGDCSGVHYTSVVIGGTDDTLNTLVFIRCRHPLAFDMIPSNYPHKCTSGFSSVLSACVLCARC
eukprot:COSAG01_NODE_3178_length_6460_cov_7.673007_6_plen_102_part_00